MVENFSEEKAEQVKILEDRVDRYEDALGTYLVKLSQKDLNVKDSHDLSIMLHCIGDFERISDHAVNIMESARELASKGMSFSDKALEELRVISGAVEDIIRDSFKVFENQDPILAKRIEPMEQVIDELNLELKNRHIKRLREGTCTIEQGFVLSDITTSLERIADHCSNIAVCISQVTEDAFDTHSYLENMKKESAEEYLQVMALSRTRYQLPI